MATSEEATAIRTPAIVPVWRPEKNFVNPEKFSIDCREYDLHLEEEPPLELREQMRRVYKQHGLVLLTNTGLSDMSAMRKYVQVIITRLADAYKGGANSRGNLAANVFDTGAPKESDLHYHHEMAYVSKSTPALGFCCQEATPGKGSTYVSDGLKTTELIMSSELGKKLKEKGITYIRCLTDRELGESDDPSNDETGIYNHWQTSFGTDSMHEVEELARERGLEIEWGGVNDRYLKTKYTCSAFEYCPNLDKNLLYASVADDSMWFDSWPGVRKLPTMGSFADECHEMHRPLKITYGDGTEFTREELQEFVDVYDAAGVELAWNVGDVVVIDNRRWAHGRPSYSLEGDEGRKLGVVLGGFYDRVGDLEDKW